MQCDPILQEVYRIKEEINQEIGGDLEKLFKRFHEFARHHPERMVPPKPKSIRRRGQQR